jgi:hypothetical protein
MITGATSPPSHYISLPDAFPLLLIAVLPVAYSPTFTDILWETHWKDTALAINGTGCSTATNFAVCRVMLLPPINSANI